MLEETATKIIVNLQLSLNFLDNLLYFLHIDFPLLLYLFHRDFPSLMYWLHEYFFQNMRNFLFFRPCRFPPEIKESFFRKDVDSFFIFGLESSNSKIKHFFWSRFFFVFWAWKVHSWNMRSFYKKFHFPKYEKNLFWENVRNILVLGVGRFISRNMKKKLLGGKYKKPISPKQNQNFFLRKYKSSMFAKHKKNFLMKKTKQFFSEWSF